LVGRKLSGRKRHGISFGLDVLAKVEGLIHISRILCRLVTFLGAFQTIFKVLVEMKVENDARLDVAPERENVCMEEIITIQNRL